MALVSTKELFEMPSLGDMAGKSPQTCACGNKFDVNHATICPKGGFPMLRHNKIRDLTANLLTEICNDVEVEPKLQVLTGEQLFHWTANTVNGARLDVKARRGSGRQSATCTI